MLGATNRFDGRPTSGGSTGNERQKVYNIMWKKSLGEKRDPNSPPEVQHTVRGLERWLEGRRKRNIPEQGLDPEFALRACSEGCVLHDHKK